MDSKLKFFTEFFRVSAIALFVLWVFFGFDVIGHFKGDKCRVSLVLPYFNVNSENTEDYYDLTIWMFFFAVMSYTYGKFAQSSNYEMIGKVMIILSGIASIIVGWQIAMGSFTGQCKDSPIAAYLQKIDGVNWYAGLTLAYLICISFSNAGHLFSSEEDKENLSIMEALKNITQIDSLIRLSLWIIKLGAIVSIGMMMISNDNAKDFREDYMKGEYGSNVSLVSNSTTTTTTPAPSAGVPTPAPTASPTPRSCLNKDRGDNSAFEEWFDLDGDDSYERVRALFIVSFTFIIVEFAAWGVIVFSNMRENNDVWKQWSNFVAKFSAFTSDFFLSFVIVGIITTNDRPDCEVYDMENATIKSSFVFIVLYMFSWIAKPVAQFFNDNVKTGDYMGLSQGLMSY
jgi:hypothetical protein